MIVLWIAIYVLLSIKTLSKLHSSKYVHNLLKHALVLDLSCCSRNRTQIVCQMMPLPFSITLDPIHTCEYMVHGACFATFEPSGNAHGGSCLAQRGCKKLHNPIVMEGRMNIAHRNNL
jgi:hypothetical protein